MPVAVRGTFPLILGYQGLESGSVRSAGNFFELFDAHKQTCAILASKQQQRLQLLTSLTCLGKSSK